MSFQSDAAFLNVLEKVSTYDTNLIFPRTVSQSVILTLLAGVNAKNTELALNQDSSNVLKSFKLKDTFSGRRSGVTIDTTKSFETIDELDDFAIAYGDGKEANSDRAAIEGYITAMDLGWTVEMTKKHKQELENYTSLNEQARKMADYVQRSMERKTRDMGLWLTKQIYFGSANTNGTAGEVTRYTDGADRPGLIGLDHICGSSKYMNITTTDWADWAGITFDTSAILFQYSIANMDTIAELIAVPDNEVYSRIFNIIRQIMSYAKTLYPGDKYAIIASPNVYDFILKPAIDRMKSGGAVQIDSAGTALSGVVGNIKGMELDLIPDDGYQISGAALLKETASYNGKFLLPSQYIYFVNLSMLKLQANKNANFTMTGWYEDKTRYGTSQNSLEATIIFKSMQRRCHMRLKINTAVLTLLAAIGQTQFTESTT